MVNEAWLFTFCHWTHGCDVNVVKNYLKGAELRQQWKRQSSFSIIHNFLPNHGRILPGLTFSGSEPLNVNTGRILPWFGRKWLIVEKIEYFLSLHYYRQLFKPVAHGILSPNSIVSQAVFLFLFTFTKYNEFRDNKSNTKNDIVLYISCSWFLFLTIITCAFPRYTERYTVQDVWVCV